MAICPSNDCRCSTYGANIGDYAGYDVNIISDVNSDGYDDILVGAYGFDKDGPPDIPDVGATYLIHGPISGDISLDQADAIFVGEGEEDYSGWSTVGGADFTGDGSR